MYFSQGVFPMGVPPLCAPRGGVPSPTGWVEEFKKKPVSLPSPFPNPIDRNPLFPAAGAKCIAAPLVRLLVDALFSQRCILGEHLHQRPSGLD